MLFSRRMRRLPRDLSLEALQDQTRVLFVDDEDRTDVIDYLHGERWHCRQLRDIDSMENTELKDSHIVCIDIRGVGRKLYKENEGLDLVVSVRNRYPEKKIILYSSQPMHNIFHKANEMLDKRIYKRSGDLEVFRSAIEELSRKCFIWPEVVTYAYARVKAYLPDDMSQESFARTLAIAATARRPWSVDKVRRALAIGADAAQIILFIIQVFSH